MILLQLSAIAIVVLYVWQRGRIAPHPRQLLTRLGLIMLGSFIAEDTVIRAYHFYAYSPDWTGFVDRVPILVIAIWPVVIHSAWDLACRLTPRPRFRPLIGAAIVLADASLIEPISVQSSLWHWTQPGIFDVPPLGILGWAIFAFFCMTVLNRHPKHPALMVPVATLFSHLALLAGWWLLFRWVNHPLAPWPFVAAAWLLSLGLTVTIVKTRLSRRVPLRDMLLRLPAAGFFFVLLALNARHNLPLVAYALAFAPPYLALVPWHRSSPRATSCPPPIPPHA